MKQTAFTQIIFVWLFLICLACNTEHKKEVQNDVLAKASRENKNGWIYVHLEGSPHDIGYQHGYLLANEIDTSYAGHLLFSST